MGLKKGGQSQERVALADEHNAKPGGGADHSGQSWETRGWRWTANHCSNPSAAEAISLAWQTHFSESLHASQSVEPSECVNIDRAAGGPLREKCGEGVTAQKDCS